MRATLISMLAVLVFSLAACFTSMALIYDAVDELDDIRAHIILTALDEDNDGTEEALVKLATRFKRREKVLQMFVSHDDLHDAYSHVVDARACFDAGDEDDMHQALAQLGEALEHLLAHESFSMSNIY